MTYRTYDDIAYSLRVALSVGPRGVLAATFDEHDPGSFGDEARVVHELVQLGAEKCADVQTMFEERVAAHRTAAADRAADLLADEQLLAQAEASLEDGDRAARDDRFTWSPTQGAWSLTLIAGLAGGIWFALPGRRLETAILLSLVTALAAIVAWVAGRALGKAPEGHRYQQTAAVGGLAAVLVVAAAALPSQHALAGATGAAVAGAGLVLGWLAGRHDRVRPRQQRCDRVTALRANVAGHGGARRECAVRIADETLVAEAALRKLRALTISACARRCSTVDDLQQATRLLSEAERRTAAWTLSSPEQAR
jgi:hypothetical protein